MITGVEPIIVKVATTGATRAAGWGVGQVRSSRRRTKLRKMVAKIESGDQKDPGVGLTAEDMAAVGRYLESSQFEHIAYSLAAVSIVSNLGRKTDEVLTSIEGELHASLTAVINEKAANIFTKDIFAALWCAVTEETARITANSSEPRVLAEAIKMVASIAAASTRNTQLLRENIQFADFLAFEDDIRSQVRSLHATMRIPHAGTTKQVPYEELFISPRLGYANRSGDAERSQQVELDDLLKRSTRSVILGDPGGGKSTLALKLAFDIASDNIPGVTARAPFLVVLRDYAQHVRGPNRLSIVEYLDTLCRTPYQVTPPQHSLEYLLLNDRALVIFDGLDELTNTSLRRDVVEAVEGFAYRFPTTQIVVTSRRIGYEDAPLNPDLFPALQLMELSAEQVGLYAQKWFALDTGHATADRQRLAYGFIADSNFVADLRVNPLMLSLMCGIYATENYIPRNRPDVYEKCALLLFESWDKQRSIQVPLSFDAHVYAALRSLALYMYAQEKQQLRRDELVRYIKSYLLDKRFDDPDVAEAAAEEFIDFCKGRAWVLTDVGEGRYGFTHKTFLEYFSASQLTRLHLGPSALFEALKDRLLAREWDVVAQLALQIVGKSAEDGADDFLQLVIDAAKAQSSTARGNLISFAARALQFIVPRPQILRSIIDLSFQLMLEDVGENLQTSRRSAKYHTYSQPAVSLFNVALELRSEVAEHLRRVVSEQLKADWRNERVLVYSFTPWLLASNIGDDFVRINWRYWEKWAWDNWSLLREYVEHASSRYYWIDVVRLGRTEITVQELLRRHGVKSLYEFQVAGDSPYPPIAYDILTIGNPRFFLRTYDLKGRRRSKLFSDLQEELIRIPAPWLPMAERYELLIPALGRHPSGRKHVPDQLFLLLSMPIVEMGHGRRVLRHVENSLVHRLTRTDKRFAHILTLRDKQDLTEEEITSALGQVELSTQLEETVRKWLAGEISFVTFPRPRRRKTTLKDQGVAATVAHKQ